MVLSKFRLIHKSSFRTLVFAVMISLFGCEVENDNTSHPNDGGISLVVDWSNTANQPNSSYRARVVAPSGSIRDFGNLSGTNNLLVVSPGEIGRAHV